MAQRDGSTGVTDPARKPDQPTARPEVDPQIELVLRMMSDLRQLVVDENIETRKQFNDGLGRMLAEQKITNGRVNALERNVASLDTKLEERTANMVCAEHAVTFGHIKEHLEDLKHLPERVARLEDHVGGSNSSNLGNSVTNDTKTSKSSLADGAAKLKLIGITGTGLAGLALLGEAIWTWFAKR